MFLMISRVSAWQWEHQGEKPMTISGLPAGILAVLNRVMLSVRSKFTEGSNRPSIPVLMVAGAEKAAKSIQPTNKKRQSAEVPVSHLNLGVGSCRRFEMVIATALRITQALLKRMCCFGDSSSIMPPQ